MAAKTSAGSGNWSSTTTWGGTVPADGDTVTIASGHTVIFDVDQSGFANGLAGLAINGTLAFSTAASTTTVLKMNASITGTGWLYMGNSEADPIPRTSTAMIDMPAINTQINPDNIRVYGWHPTDRNHTQLSADAALNATTITLTDGLDVAAGEQVVIGCGNVNGVQTEGNKGVYTVQSYDGGTKTITLTAGLQTERLAGDYVAILSRRCTWQRRSAQDSATITAKNSGVAVGLWIKNTRPINGSSWTVSWSTGQNNINGGLGYYSHGTKFLFCTGQNSTQGAISSWGIGIEIVSCIGMVSTTSGIAGYGTATLMNCVAQNNSNGGLFYHSSGVAINCDARNNANGGLAFYGSYNFTNCTASKNTNGDLYLSQSAKLTGCNLLSSTEFGGYNSVYRGATNLAESIDHDGIVGAYKSWTLGGITTSVTTPLHGTEARVYQMAPEKAATPCWWQRRYQVPAGKTATITAWLRKTVTMATLPQVQIFADGVDPLIDGTTPLSSWTMTDSVDTWERQVLTYNNTTTVDAIITVRLLCRGTTGYVYSDILAVLGGGVSRARIMGGI